MGTSDHHTGAEECELLLELLGSVILRGAVDGNTFVGRLAGAKVCSSIDGIVIVVESRMLGVSTSQSAPSQHEHHTFSISCFIQGSMYNDLDQYFADLLFLTVATRS